MSASASRSRSAERPELAVGVLNVMVLALENRAGRPDQITQHRIVKIAAENRRDLCDLTSDAQPIEACGKRLLQRRGNSVKATLLAPLQQQVRDFLDE